MGTSALYTPHSTLAESTQTFTQTKLLNMYPRQHTENNIQQQPPLQIPGALMLSDKQAETKSTWCILISVSVKISGINSQV